MQELLLNEDGAKILMRSIRELLDADNGFVLKNISIKSGDPSGNIDGYSWIEVKPTYNTKTIGNTCP